MAGDGASRHAIASAIGVSPPTLREHYAAELSGAYSVGKPKTGINRQPENRPNPDDVQRRLDDRDARKWPPTPARRLPGEAGWHGVSWRPLLGLIQKLTETNVAFSAAH